MYNIRGSDHTKNLINGETEKNPEHGFLEQMKKLVTVSMSKEQCVVGANEGNTPAEETSLRNSHKEHYNST